MSRRGAIASAASSGPVPLGVKSVSGSRTAGGSVAGNTLSWTHTVDVGVDCVIIFAGQEGTSGQQITSVTVGGVAGSVLLTTVSVSSFTDPMEMWLVLNPPVGSQTVAVTYSISATASPMGIAVSVANGTPSSTAQVSGTSGTSLATAALSSAIDRIVLSACVSTTSTPTQNYGATNLKSQSSGGLLFESCDAITGAASITPTYTKASGQAAGIQAVDLSKRSIITAARAAFAPTTGNYRIPDTALVGKIYAICVVDNASRPTTPSGWNLFAQLGISGAALNVYYKVLVTGEPGSTISFGANAMCISGYGTRCTSIDVSSNNHYGGSVTSTPSSTPVTTTAPNDTIIYWVCANGNPPAAGSTLPAGTSEPSGPVSQGFEALFGAVEQQAAAGLSTARTFNTGLANSQGVNVYTLALKQ